MPAFSGSIRAMQAADLDFAAQLTSGEGWVSENRTSLEGLYQNDPDGCLLAEWDGQPVGICFATSYGKSGFIGELIVRPEARGQGVGAALLNHAVTYLRSRSAETVYLDGVPKAVPLYERNGFRILCRSLRFAGKLAGQAYPDVRAMQPEDLPGVFALDARMFTADRSFFLARRLELYPELCKVMVARDKLTGYIVGRRGEGWLSAGPWVIAEPASDPLRLLRSFALAANDRPFNIGILASNMTPVTLMRGLGFQERPDSPWRMALGPAQDLGASPYCLAVGTAGKG